MSRINLFIISIASVSLLLWYLLFIRQMGLVAYDMQLSTEEDIPVQVRLGVKNKVDEYNEIEIIDFPKHGTVHGKQQNWIYSPKPDFFGSDRFTYRVVSSNKKSRTAEVTISIAPVNDPPEVESLELLADEDSIIQFSLKGRDSEGDALRYSIVDQPKHGRLVGREPILEYVPDRDFAGYDSFTYKATDNDSYGETATVNIDIHPINDTPRVKNQKLIVFENTQVSFKFEASDPDSSELSYKVTETPQHGRIEVRNGQYIYIPVKNYIGNDWFFYTAKDEELESAPAMFEFEVRKIDRGVDLNEVLTKVVQHGGVAIGSDLKPEHVIHSGKYVPASILKIVTAAAALHYLGPKYRFKTEFYIDKNMNLYIKGFGDPSLSSKNWHEIARYLRSKKLFDQELNRLVIDSTAFSENLKVDGRRHTNHYYDAPSSALPSNQNTIALRIKKSRRIRVIDEYTPLTKHVTKRAKRLPVGYQYFNIAFNAKESVEYSAALVAEIFKEYGALFNENDLQGKVPKDLSPVYVFRSEFNLHSVVKEMLRESNNFIANQLLLVLAYETKGEGFGIEMGAQIISGFLEKEIGLDQREFQLVEGSGLSTRNNIDLVAMLKVVSYFKKYRTLLPHLRISKYSDLAKAGRKWNIVAKSGTLSNVETLAGFMRIRKKEWKPFVIMLNNNAKKRGTVLEIIARYYNG